jgi:hypothetical protein
VFFKFCKTNTGKEKAALFYVTSLLPSDIQTAGTSVTERWLRGVQRESGRREKELQAGEVKGRYCRLMS